LIDNINAGDESDVNSPTRPPRKRKNEALYEKLLPGKLDHLNNAHVFHDENENDFKCTNVVEHQIQVGDTKPIRKPPYRTPYALREEMKNQVQTMLDKGVIRPNDSPWAAPGILVPKKRGPDGKP